MLMRDVAHEARNGGEAFTGTFAAPVVTVAERAQVVAVSGQTRREQPRATERRRCVAVPHDAWVHPSEQTETTRLGLHRPVRRSQAAVGCQGAIRHEHLHAQVWGEGAATVLVCDMRPASLLAAFTGLRDLLRFLLAIALTNTRRFQDGQQAPGGTGLACEHNEDKPTW